MAHFSLFPSGEAAELGDDIRLLLEDLLLHGVSRETRAYSGECQPALDVLETDTTLEVTLDVPGVPAEAIRVLFRAGVLVIVGLKTPAAAAGESSFHLVEREFGRFARIVRVTGAVDVGNARAALRDGELVVVLPKLQERRGRPHRIPVTSQEG